MDLAIITTIASSVVSLLSPYLVKAGEGFAQSTGKAAWEKTKELFQAIKNKFGNKDDSKRTLIDLEKNPNNTDFQLAVKQQLEKIMLADEDFAEKIFQLLKQASDSGVDQIFNTKVYGNVKNITNMRDVNGPVTIS